MFQIIALQHCHVDAYKYLTFNHLVPSLQRVDHLRFIAIGAECLDNPVGLVFAAINHELQSAEILSIFVKSEFRKLGVGVSLLMELENRLMAIGCNLIKLSYFSGKSSTSILEQFLNKNGWSAPVVQSLIYTADMESTANFPWIKQARFPGSMHSFLWSELSETDREKVQDGYPANLSPFKNEHLIEKKNSVGIRVNNEVVGWSITHRVAEDTLIYNSLFVQSKYQHLGCAFTMLAASIQLQLKHQIPYGMFAVNLNNPIMVKIVDRWFKPYMKQTTEMRAVYKTIARSSG